MAGSEGQDCPFAELIEQLAAGELTGEARRRAERALEEHEACREQYRRLTAGKFPELPNYTIIEQVGKGGFGVVYKAIHHTKERVEALKVLFSKTPLLTSYFENEVHLIARLRHPNIATLFEAQLSAPPLYYTMEFVEGERLNDYLKRRELSLAGRIEIIRTVALALDYAHRQGVVHRDIKPQNILIDDTGQPHIVDFGIAKKLTYAEPAEEDDLLKSKPEGPVGTLGYIAPEQAKGAPLDSRADIFSLGAMLFHCVTGEPARQARDGKYSLKLLRELGIGQPEDLAAIIARCVDEIPERRYETCAALASDLDRYLRGEHISARSDSTLAYRAARILALLLRNHPSTVRAAIVVLVAVGLAAMFSAFGARSLTPQLGGDRVAIIGFGTQTREMLVRGEIGAELEGLDPYNFVTWRSLHAKLMERLAEAEPLVVVWDYYFPRSSEFDEAFARGVRALKAPVVVGVVHYDINGEPELSPALREAVHSYGSLAAARPSHLSGEFVVPAAIQRGFEDPIPSLSVAAFAAALFSQSQPQLHATDEFVTVRYRKKHTIAGRLRWETREDKIPVTRSFEIDARNPFKLGDEEVLRGDDVVYTFNVDAHRPPHWEERIIPYERVLTAETRQLRSWFGNKAVVIGQMIPGIDSYPTAQGENIFGCEVHALALDALLSSAYPYPMSRRELSLRTLLWASLAGLLVTARRPTVRRPLSWQAGGAAGVALAGLCTGIWAAAWVTEPWAIEAAIAVCTLLTTGALAYLARAVRDRQLLLSPQAVTITSDDAELPSTLLAETR